MAIYEGDTITLSPDGAFAGLGRTITEYLWIFDGIEYPRLPVAPNLVIENVIVGTYYAELKIVNSCGAISLVKTTTFTVLEPYCPIPTITGITMSPEDAFAGDNVTLSPVGAFAGLGKTITEYLWDIGTTGYASFSPNFVIANVTVGTYQIKLRIKNSCGSISEAKYLTFTVLEVPCPIPTLTGIIVS